MADSNVPWIADVARPTEGKPVLRKETPEGHCTASPSINKPPKVCILAAGHGSRLKEYARWVHKALLPLGNRAILSRIIEQFPCETEFVIAVGHRANLIEDYLPIAHPKQHFTLVRVENYDGPGSGPGHSLRCCRAWLDTPFIFTACDTLITCPLPPADRSWVGVQQVDDIERWCSVEVDRESRVTALHYKLPGVNTDLAYVGIACVTEPALFWRGMENAELEGVEVQVNAGLAALFDRGLMAHPLAWEDSGVAENYEHLLRTQGEQYTFAGKVNEFTFRCDGHILKLCETPENAAARYHRAQSMPPGLLPEVVELRGNIFTYRFQEGDLLSTRLNYSESTAFLEWAQQKLWRCLPIDPDAFENSCHEFYVVKTVKRLAQFIDKCKFEEVDAQPIEINGLRCFSAKELVDDAYARLRKGGIPSTYHGDLHAGNVIKTASDYRLIDWRQGFGASVEVGDRYYDLAKFLHTLDLSVETMVQGNFTAVIEGDRVRIDHEIRLPQMQARDAFFAFVAKYGYRAEQIHLVNGLIFLNMAPLYAPELGQYLYFLGRYTLQSAIV